MYSCVCLNSFLCFRLTCRYTGYLDAQEDSEAADCGAAQMTPVKARERCCSSSCAVRSALQCSMRLVALGSCSNIDRGCKCLQRLNMLLHIALVWLQLSGESPQHQRLAVSLSTYCQATFVRHSLDAWGCHAWCHRLQGSAWVSKAAAPNADKASDNPHKVELQAQTSAAPTYLAPHTQAAAVSHSLAAPRPTTC